VCSYRTWINAAHLAEGHSPEEARRLAAAVAGHFLRSRLATLAAADDAVDYATSASFDTSASTRRAATPVRPVAQVEPGRDGWPVMRILALTPQQGGSGKSALSPPSPSRPCRTVRQSRRSSWIRKPRSPARASGGRLKDSTCSRSSYRAHRPRRRFQRSPSRRAGDGFVVRPGEGSG
jgi:hypothetical protein